MFGAKEQDPHAGGSYKEEETARWPSSLHATQVLPMNSILAAALLIAAVLAPISTRAAEGLTTDDILQRFPRGSLPPLEFVGVTRAEDGRFSFGGSWPLLLRVMAAPPFVALRVFTQLWR
jgi:hypothetical protein